MKSFKVNFCMLTKDINMYYIYQPYHDLTFCIRELGQNVKNGQNLTFKRPPVTLKLKVKVTKQ